MRPIIRRMFLKAGALSLALLLASRVLGLLRESAQAAALGTTGLADVVVLMWTLPDWLSAVLAGGALAYVLLPQWARQPAPAQSALQRRCALALLAGGGALALGLVLAREGLARALVPGLAPALQAHAGHGLAWVALALPAALLAALWGTRLQHEKDFIGLYAASLVVNGVLVLASIFVANNDHWVRTQDHFWLIFMLGAALGLAMALRLGWLRWRLRLVAIAAAKSTAPAWTPAPMGKVSLWGWAVLACGLPLLLPFMARSLASAGGEGALATFNYAWKLVELPLVLAIQLVASLALPALTRCWGDPPAARRATRAAFALAWTLACAAVAGLLVAAPAVAQLLFGWGRMRAESLAQVAGWGALGAWSLPPQALLAVALAVLATQQRMAWAVLGQVLALALLVLAMAWGVHDGGALMGWLTAAQWLAAAVCLLALGSASASWLPWACLLATGGALVGLVGLAPWVGALHGPLALAVGTAAAVVVVGVGWFAGPDLRHALRR